MKKISAAIIQPTVIAMGASIFLYAYDKNLPIQDYFLHLPFWVIVVRPTGLYWQSSFLKQINKGVFPPEMKVYREMYVVSKNAILYDVLLNHTLYHAILTPALITYMYAIKTLLDNRNKSSEEKKDNQLRRNSLGGIFKDSFMTLVQGRALISCVSILSEYWITYAALKRQGSTSTFSLPTNVKRALMAKQMLLSWSWSGLILKQFFRNYQIQTKNVQ